ncbi:hypothetical protein BTO06_09240 [Tenacibaculum sp. SZ-18]|nr:hypothetical protein BTO06_09240 [Tenacibaculum sp. SZ-18]
MSSKLITLPKRLTINYLNEFIQSLNFVFDLIDERKPRFFLNFEKVEKVDIVGVLVLYKFIEFSVEKKCFYNP